jgi:hypothetical protein
MFTLYSLGDAHTAWYIKAEDDTDVLSSQFLVLNLGASLNQIINSVRFRNLFIFKLHVICVIAKFTIPSLLFFHDNYFAVFVECGFALFAQFWVTSSKLCAFL